MGNWAILPLFTSLFGVCLHFLGRFPKNGVNRGQKLPSCPRSSACVVKITIIVQKNHQGAKGMRRGPDLASSLGREVRELRLRGPPVDGARGFEGRWPPGGLAVAFECDRCHAAGCYAKADAAPRRESGVPRSGGLRPQGTLRESHPPGSRFPSRAKTVPVRREFLHRGCLNSPTTFEEVDSIGVSK